MKNIIFFASLLFSSYLFSMDNCIDGRKLIVRNQTNKIATVCYKKVLPHHVLPKKEHIAPGRKIEIPLSMTGALQIQMDGYEEQKVYAKEYQTPVVICQWYNYVRISQGNETLGSMKQIQKKAA